MYYVLAIAVLTFILIISYRSLKHEKLYDSALKRRSLFSSEEYKLFVRLKDALPDCQILTKVSFDALLTTKLLRTRHKYRTMVADFVIADASCQILAIVAFSDTAHNRRIYSQDYSDQLLQFAGYRVVRYQTVPEVTTLREQLEKLLMTPATAAARMNLSETALLKTDNMGF